MPEFVCPNRSPLHSVGAVSLHAKIATKSGDGKREAGVGVEALKHAVLDYR